IRSDYTKMLSTAVSSVLRSVLENDDNTDKNNIYLDNILDLNASEFLEGLDEFIEDSDINLEEEANNDKINQEEIDEDWDPKLA
ncbi:7644_t:CDS:2, partial [Funneliformis mosseae]